VADDLIIRGIQRALCQGLSKIGEVFFTGLAAGNPSSQKQYILLGDPSLPMINRPTPVLAPAKNYPAKNLCTVQITPHRIQVTPAAPASSDIWIINLQGKHINKLAQNGSNVYSTALPRAGIYFLSGKTKWGKFTERIIVRE
jgi:hypothetical protein